MTYSEDRVLVGVINRKRDLEYPLEHGWYRIPQKRMSRGIQTEYIAFFLSRAFGEQNGGIHYYARLKGLELVPRRWLIPDELDHPRADDPYYRIALDPVAEKRPPILNPTRRSIAFIYTTFDRFTQAQVISDLYSKGDHLVDRIYHALRRQGVRSQRFWEAENKEIPFAPGLVIPAKDGLVYASIHQREDALYMDWGASQKAIIAEIQKELARRGGFADVNIPVEDD